MKIIVLHSQSSRVMHGCLCFLKNKAGILLLPFLLSFFSWTGTYGQVAPVLTPNGGFHIDGNLKANTPTAGVGDWVNGPGGSGGFLINNNGTVIDPLMTYNLADPYSTNTDIVFIGGSKINDNPVDWTWSNQSAPPKNDINRGLIHIARDANDDVWLIMAGDRLSNNGDSYIDFELLQNTMTRNITNGHFNTAGPHGGRTVNDLLITVEYSNGGGVSEIFYRKWLPNGSGGYSYQVISPGPFGITMNNSGIVDVPFGAFGNTTYQPLQFVEAAVNLSQVINSTVNGCEGMDIKTLFIKTKASSSITAELKDFIEPLQLHLGVNEVVLASVNPLCVTAAPVTLVGDPAGGTYSGPGVSGNSFNPALAGPGIHNIIYSLEVKPGCFQSDTISVQIDPASMGGAVSEDDTVCVSGNSGTLTLSGNVGAVLMWQQSVDGGATWTDIANTSASQGYNNLTQTTMFRAVVQSGVCDPANSNPATITVDPASVGGVVSADDTVCISGNSGTLTLSGNVGVVLMWQQSVDGGATWTDIANNTSSQGYNNLTQTTMFRAVVQSGVCDPANSSPATITVDPASVGGAVSEDDTVCISGNSGTLTLSGNVGVVLMWQQSVDGGATWTDIANTSASQGYNNLTQTTMFRAVVQSGICDPANSSPATITVDPASVGGAVSEDDTVCISGNSGTLTLSGNVGVVLMWQQSVDGGATWTDIANNTSSQGYNNLTQTTMFRAVVQSGVCDPANSSPATITVDMPPVGGSVSSATLCANTETGTLTLSGYSGTIIKWQSSADGGTTWTDIANTSSTLDVGPLTATTLFRAVIGNGVCSNINSAYGTVEVINCATGYCTYTQGFYGNLGGVGCDGGDPGIMENSKAKMLKSFDLLGVAKVVFGKTNIGGILTQDRAFTLFRQDIVNNNIYAMLPGGGPAAALGIKPGGIAYGSTYEGATYNVTGTWNAVPLTTNGGNIGKIKNVLLAQTMTLFFNMNNGINLAGLTLHDTLLVTSMNCQTGDPVPGAPILKYVLPHNVLVYMSQSATYPLTVAGLYQLANDKLGGVVTGSISPSDVNNAVDAINNAFDGCRSLVGYVDLPGTGAQPFSGNLSETELENSLSVLAYPNPFKDKVIFNITARESSPCVIEIYNMVGQRVHTEEVGNIAAGIMQIIEFKVPPTLLNGNFFYVVKAGTEKVSGKMISVAK